MSAYLKLCMIDSWIFLFNSILSETSKTLVYSQFTVHGKLLALIFYDFLSFQFKCKRSFIARRSEFIKGDRR